MITDYAREPESGQKPECLVVFMHGYGSSGDLMRQYVGDQLGPMLPNAKLHFPDAPVQMGWNNHSWFELRDVISRQDDIGLLRRTAQERAPATANELNEYISRIAAESGVAENRIVIAGFSQGGTMAVYTGLMRETQVAGVFAISGGALDLVPDIRSKPPVKLVAGELEYQHYSGAPHAVWFQTVLKQQEFRAEAEIITGQEHDASPKALELLRDFVVSVVPDTAPKTDAKPAQKRAGFNL
ncbi:MAG TPA: hypothetical protein VEF76_14585 [Patescibacteria group bacterium]|nr:hypothetical protein [Patescibacteria group bacterium]